MKNREERLYDYKYHMNCSRRIWWFSLGFVNLFIFTLYLGVDKAFHNNMALNHFLKIYNVLTDISFIGVVALNVYIYKYWKKNYAPTWKFKRFMQSNLDYFIDQNNFCSSHKEKRAIGDGKSEEVKVIDYLPSISYRQDGKKVYVYFTLDGSLMSEKFYELEQRLSNLLNLEYLEKNQVDGCIIYSFAIFADKRLNINAHTNFKSLCNTQEIRITENLSWNFRKCPHALITGGTGSGKTFILIYLIKCFCALGSNVKIIDPKRSDLSQLKNSLGEENVAYDNNKIAQLLREVRDEMNKRYDDMGTRSDYGFGKDFVDYGLKPIFILFDEMMAYMGAVDSKLQKEVLAYLTDIIAKGRQAGVFMILTSQRADGEYIKPSIRDQLGLRVALGQMSADGYVMTFGGSNRDLQLKNYDKGDGFIYVDGLMSVPRQFSSPFIDTKNGYNILSGIQ